MDYSNTLPDDGDTSRYSRVGGGHDVEKPRSSINKYYRPFSTSTTVLVTIILALGTCIALLEILIHNSTSVENTVTGASRRDVERRQTTIAAVPSTVTTTDAVATTPSITTIPSSHVTATTVDLAYESLTSSSFVTTLYAATIWDYLAISTDTTAAGGTAPTIMKTTVGSADESLTSNTVSITTATATTSNYLAISTDTLSESGTKPTFATFNEVSASYVTLTTEGTAYEALKSTTTSPSVQGISLTPTIAPSPASSQYDNLNGATAGDTSQSHPLTTVVPLLTTESAYQTLTSPETSYLVSSVAESEYVTLQAFPPSPTLGTLQAIHTTSRNSPSPQPTVITTSNTRQSQGAQATDSRSYSLTGYVYAILSTTTSDGATIVATSTATAIVTGASTYLTMVEVTSDGSIATVMSTATSLLTGQDLVASSTSTGPVDSPTPGQAILLKSGSELRVSHTFNTVDYFNAMYLSTLVAVLLKSVWSIVFAATKMMEPFHQLAKPGGATAEDSLMADYLSSGLTVGSLKAMLQGHWVMALTSAVYVIFGVLASLSTEAMSTKPTQYCPTGVGNAVQPCNPAWVLELPIVRSVEVLAGVLIILIIVLVVIQWNRSSGVYSDPSTIASVASLLHQPDVVQDLRNVEPDATKDGLDRALIGSQYMLGTYESSPGTCRYGIIKTVATTKLLSQQSRYQAVSNPGDQHSHHQRTFPWKSIRDVVFGLVLLALFGVILAYYLDSQADAFNTYFNSGTFGPRFVLTFVAVIVDFQWKRLEREVRIMDVYRRLSKRQARPDKTILQSMTGTPVTTLPTALWHGNFFTATIALVALLSDILIISVGGVPFQRAEIFPAFLASAYVSLAILGLMVLSLLAIFIWRAGNPKMPRDPDTLACVLSYLCDSRLPADLEGYSVMDAKRRDRMVRRMGKKYFFGRRGHQDGLERWCVDEDDHGGTVVY